MIAKVRGKMEALEGLQRESFEFVFRKKMEDLLRIWVAPYKLRMLRFLSGSESRRVRLVFQCETGLALLDRIALEFSVKLLEDHCVHEGTL